MRLHTKLFLLIIIVFVISTSWTINYIKKGDFERYIDSRHSTIIPPIQYFFAMMLNLSARKESALRWFLKIHEQYPKNYYAPLGWSEAIEILDQKNDRKRTEEEINKFLEEYPDGPKTEIMRKKLYLLKNA